MTNNGKLSAIWCKYTERFVVIRFNFFVLILPIYRCFSRINIIKGNRIQWGFLGPLIRVELLVTGFNVISQFKMLGRSLHFCQFLHAILKLTI